MNNVSLSQVSQFKRCPSLETAAVANLVPKGFMLVSRLGTPRMQKATVTLSLGFNAVQQIGARLKLSHYCTRGIDEGPTNCLRRENMIVRLGGCGCFLQVYLGCRLCVKIFLCFQSDSRTEAI